jgi:hypothetical protein
MFGCAMHWTEPSDLPWPSRRWSSVRAEVAAGEIRATLPIDGPAVIYFTVAEFRGVVMSSPFAGLEQR